MLFKLSAVSRSQSNKSCVVSCSSFSKNEIKYSSVGVREDISTFKRVSTLT